MGNFGQIEIRIERVYGKDLFYPQCPAADIFAKLSKTKTLDKHQLAYIKSLGFEIKYFTIINGNVVAVAA